MAKTETPIDVALNEQQVVVPNAIANRPAVVVDAPAARPQRFTLLEIYQMITALTWPWILFDLLSRHRLSSVFLGLGLLVVDILEALQGFNLIQQLAIFGTGILLHVAGYTSLRPYLRFRPYERLINVDVDLSLTPETAVRLVNYINRWVVTLQFFFFGTELFELLLITIALEVVHSICMHLDAFLLIRIAFCTAYAIPRLRAFIEHLNPFSRAYFLLKAKQSVLAIVAKLEGMGFEVKLGLIERWKMEVDALRELYFEYEYWRTQVQIYDVEML
ncbi:uncharacterized protein LOC6549916 [Drosophila erecta]|uniref:Reticulon-like protein n=1 Tax=Drosophila erecta TaxID=7220 RepID=B3NYB6_DROER|nr:uncharacterized protein LOC6549916 [Drosophila erecta]EDV47595.1 uncharacterized protein Dere_GG19713 [Drosophila erecta]